LQHAGPVAVFDSEFRSLDLIPSAYHGNQLRTGGGRSEIVADLRVGWFGWSTPQANEEQCQRQSSLLASA
jgi:hypothetical protein